MPFSAPGARTPHRARPREVHLHDESYWKLLGDPGAITLLATAVEDGKPQPLVGTMEYPRGRIFVAIPGHYSWSFDAVFRIILLRGIAWAAGEPVDRFAEITLPGARSRTEAPGFPRLTAHRRKQTIKRMEGAP